MDQLSPKAYLVKDINDDISDNKGELSISRNITPRVTKLGVSMRTGNGQKTINNNALKSWQLNKTTDPVQLLYVETENDLYGDKVYSVDKDFTEKQLQEIKADIDKMIANLGENDKPVGYIYYDKESKLYLMLQAPEYKGKVVFKKEEQAQGDEAKYYIVENNRKAGQSEDAYWRSLYTGVSRAEQASIVIAPSTPIGRLLVKRPTRLENKLIPDSFTANGIARFAKQRRDILNSIYEDLDDSELLKAILPKDKVEIPLISDSGGPGGLLSDMEDPNTVAETDENKEPTTPKPEGDKTEDDKLIENARTKKPVKVPKEKEPLPSPTEWEVTDENIQKVYQGIQAIGVTDLFKPNTLTFSLYLLSEQLKVKQSDLYKILAQLTRNGIVTDNSSDFFDFDLEKTGLIKVETEGPTEEEAEEELVPTAKYKIGDQFKRGKNNQYIQTISNVEWNSLKGKFKYTLSGEGKDATLYENSLTKLDEKGYFTPKEDIINEDDAIEQPSMAATAFGAEHLEKAIEADAEAAEELNPLPEEIVEVETEVSEETVKDIQYNVFGYTAYTNYLGMEFKNGKPIVPKPGEPGCNRIDQANGLVKLDPIRYGTEEACRRAIGDIRKAIMSRKNEDLIKFLLREIPALSGEIKIKWAFISKSKEHSDPNSLFYYDPNYKLENVEDDEQSEIPIKTFSLLVQDEAENCVLEIPVLNLSSPFTALYKLFKLNPDNDIVKAYLTAAADESLKPFQALEAVKNEIKSKGLLKQPGYKKLYDMCNLWQFTSDGIQLIPNVHRGSNSKRGDNFDLVRHCVNLGQRYVKNRMTDVTINGKKNPYDYSMHWNELTEETKRTDVNFSSIMLATSELDRNNNRIAAPGHPFVLRSTSDEFTTDEAMMSRYIWLQLPENSKEPKTVILIPLTPPETSVSEYLKLRKKGRDCHYGNEFTAYRILSIIEKNASDLFKQINKFGEVAALIHQMDEIQAKLDQADDLNHQQYMSLVYQEQKKILNSNNLKLLSNALFELTWDYNGDASNVELPNEENIARIQQLCDAINPETNKPYLTGVLYRPVCRPAKEVDRISGYGVLIQTGTNKYTNPDGLSYRIYSRYDTPLFDLSVLTNAFANWSGKIRKRDNYDNVYYFDTGGKRDYSWQFYSTRNNKSKAKIQSENTKIRNKHRRLLNKLATVGITDTSTLNEIDDEQKFLEALRDLYIETPGNVAVVAGGTLIYSNLKNVALIDGKFDEEYTTAKLKSIEFNGDGDNTYTLTLLIGNEEKLIQVQIKSKEQRISFDLGLKIEQLTSIKTFDFTATNETILKKIDEHRKKKNTGYEKLFVDAQKIINDGIAAGLSRAEIIANLTNSLDPRALRTVRLAIQDFFNIDSTEEKKSFACSTKVTKKIVI